MPPRDYRIEARRWVKFPATILLITGVLWLIRTYFELDWTRTLERTETLVGSVAVLTELVLIPLGSVVIGIGLLFLQRWALWLAYIIPLFPLVILTGEKVLRIGVKFDTYRQTSDVSEFGDGVMTALLVLALWALYVLIVLYLFKAWLQLKASRAWWGTRHGPGSITTGEPCEEQPELEDELCLLMPETAEDETPLA